MPVDILRQDLTVRRAAGVSDAVMMLLWGDLTPRPGIRL